MRKKHRHEMLRPVLRPAPPDGHYRGYQKVNAPTLSRMMSMLLGRTPVSASELSYETSIARKTVVQYLGIMHRHDPPVVYVAGWERGASNKSWIPLYLARTALCRKTDVPRPKMTGAERQASYAARKRDPALQLQAVFATKLRAGDTAVSCKAQPGFENAYFGCEDDCAPD